MTADVRDRICMLLDEAVRLLDREQRTLAAIRVSEALDSLRCPFSDRPGRSRSSEAAPESR